jgi:hypothetical protein
VSNDIWIRAVKIENERTATRRQRRLTAMRLRTIHKETL